MRGLAGSGGWPGRCIAATVCAVQWAGHSPASHMRHPPGTPTPSSPSPPSHLNLVSGSLSPTASACTRTAARLMVGRAGWARALRATGRAARRCVREQGSGQGEACMRLGACTAAVCSCCGLSAPELRMLIRVVGREVHDQLLPHARCQAEHDLHRT